MLISLMGLSMNRHYTTNYEGQQESPPEQWSDFRRALNYLLHLAGLKRFALILIDGPIN